MNNLSDIEIINLHAFVFWPGVDISIQAMKKELRSFSRSRKISIQDIINEEKNFQ
jgi:ABC-type Zn2+ transport system substrate-binding protein/surface adhesin